MFNVRTFIKTKMEGLIYKKGEIKEFIKKYMSNEINDTHMAAWLTAVSIKGITFQELIELTESMVYSGDVLYWNSEMLLVDKHSTGGVGDKTTLIVAPIVASLGIPMVKLSGPGLGHTGGTVDKLKSIANINLEKSKEEILEQIKETNLYLGSHASNIVPADKKIYNLRNEIGAINHIGLIAASIISKKIATGANSFIFDVKVGKGALVKSIEEARILAKTLIDLAKNFDKKVSVVISNMNEPLGKAIGNQLEVIECINILKNKVNIDTDLKELSLVLSALCILNSNYPCDSFENALKLAEVQIKNGEAYATLEKTISAQGGNLNNVDFEEAEFTCDFFSMENGVISSLDALDYGIASQYLGSGIIDSDKDIIPTAGILLNKKVGDVVFAGENIARLFYDISRSNFLKPMLKKLDIATTITNEIVKKESIIIDIIF